MKTGLESLDTGASKITYRGNEGPKSPQQIASMEAGQESTLEEIFNELIEMGMSPEDAAIKAREIYNNMDMSSSQKGIGNLAMADPMLVEQYQQYVFEMEEQGLQPMSFEEFVAQARAGMNKGGIMDSKYNIENRRQYFSGAYGQGAGDRGGDPRGSREENVAAGRTDAGNIQRAEEYRRQQSQTTSPPPSSKPSGAVSYTHLTLPTIYSV